MTTKTKTKKKSKDRTQTKKQAKAMPPVDPSWSSSGIDVSKKNVGLRLFKRLGSAKHADDFTSSLGWLLNADVDPATVSKINGWHWSLLKCEKQGQVAEDFLSAIQAMPEKIEDPNDALIVLAACQSIRAIAGKCEFSQWQSLVARLLEISRAAESGDSLPPEIHQQLAIELPLTIAFQVPEIEDYQLLSASSFRKMAIKVTSMLDHDGWPSARYLPMFGPIVASWVRCSSLMNESILNQGLEAASQLEWLVRQVLRMLRPDGTLVFSDPKSAPAQVAFLKCLLDWSNDSDDKKLMNYATVKDGKFKTPAVKLGIEPGNISEWSESALLQSRWEFGSPKVAVDFSENGVRTELCCNVNLILGDTHPEVTINGVAQQSSEPFEVTCIESDEDVDYLELTKDLGNGVALTRQYLLSRNEEFLLVADLVVPSEAARIDYRGTWPLAAGIEGMHESETREVYLRGGAKIQSLVLPLALPEWKTGRTDDKLDFQDGALCLTQSIDGRGLYAPLFFDLSRKRSKRKRTWRQLTVAENREIVHRDEACAFRVQLDKQQWVFYRAVTTTGSRTYIGENVVSEFAFNRFLKNGRTEQLIEVQ